MNLLEMMKLEILSLNLVEPIDIVNHIYKRTGEIFEYDPFHNLFDTIEKSAQKEIDIYNIDNLYVDCYKWAHIFINLLNAFGIKAKTTSSGGVHVYVLVTINKERYQFDLTSKKGDLMRIKFGLNTVNNCIIKNENGQKKIIKMSEQNEPTEKEKKLQTMKEKLALIRRKYSQEDYIYLVYKLIEELLKDHKGLVGYSSGTSYIKHLLSLFLDENNKEFKPTFVKFFNLDDRTFFRVDRIIRNDKEHYFTYKHQPNGEYIMKEETQKQIDEYIRSYDAANAYNIYRNPIRRSSMIAHA